jgi:hypothetical protein
MAAIDPARLESLGPAERIVQTLTTWTDHMVHNRPGLVSEATGTPTGTRWQPVSWKQEGEERVVYGLVRKGRKNEPVRLGVLGADGTVRDGRRELGRYREPGIYPEVAAWLYGQVAAVWKLDNEFVARWGSWALAQENRDQKVVLAAFLLVQNRAGDPVRGPANEVLFFDEDHRDVGEAIVLARRNDKRDLNPKLLLRIGDLLSLPAVAAINRELGFGKSARAPILGRWPKVVEKWLRHRERNPRVLEGLVKAGFRTTVMRLAQRVGYKPDSQRFFEILRWRQKQAADGRRRMALDLHIAAAESWDGLTEAEICERIVATKPGWKRIVGLLPKSPGLTRAIAAAAIEAGSLSDADLVILTPTLEELGLLQVPAILERWRDATGRAENQRAANVAQRVRSKEAADALNAASDRAVQQALAEVTRELRVYVFVDKSGSMEGAIERAKTYLARFLQGFPLDRLHVATFNTVGSEIKIRHASAAGVEHAFRGQGAGGGTSYGWGVRALAQCRPLPGEDVLFLFVGDQADGKGTFEDDVRASGLEPVAFGLLEVIGSWGSKGSAVEDTAQRLGIPCFPISEDMFGDAYAVPRVLRDLVASTPVRARTARGPDLVTRILQTPLLEKPVWA